VNVNGWVDNSGRALIALSIRANAEARAFAVETWIDTAFDGDLVIPAGMIENFGLSQSSGVQATLADGSAVVLETFQCEVDWFGSLRQVEAIANEGQFPLLGVALLKDRRLMIDYVQRTVKLM
jgi:clan AA aspartic protease